MHPKELKKVKNNTGRFTHLSLENSHLFVGIDFSHHEKINEIIATHNAYVLFPSENALNLSHTPPENFRDKELAIFLIDSTWSCTKKIFEKSTNLQKLQHMSFTTKQKSRYEIKEQPHSNYLSTIESTLVVLEALNKHKIEDIASSNLQGFLNPFLNMVAYQKKLILGSEANMARYKRH